MYVLYIYIRACVYVCTIFIIADVFEIYLKYHLICIFVN